MTYAGSPKAPEQALRHVAGLASGPPVDPMLRVTLNFHPDRLLRGTLLLDALAEDGVYHSQFVTGIGNGGLSAYPGGDRWRWESRIFGGAYDDAPAHGRPVYGALNFRRKPLGGAPRFGSAHFRLTAGTMARTTFCCPHADRGRRRARSPRHRGRGPDATTPRRSRRCGTTWRGTGRPWTTGDRPSRAAPVKSAARRPPPAERDTRTPGH
ncbi:Protein of unknown function [Streptomyces sp. BpilaLS-43]|nr:Protein of unknown function [Streptomyces sp. BpilaLS-43]